MAEADMHDPLPPECEDLFQAQKAAQEEHQAAWGAHEAYMAELGMESGHITTITHEQGQELQRRADRLETATTDWNRKLKAWLVRCGGMRFRYP